MAHDVSSAKTGGMSRLMAFVHDPLAALGYDVDYFHADDVPRGPRSLRRFSFPMAVYRASRLAARSGRPYDLINIHEPSALPTLLGRHRAGNPVVVVTTHGIEERAWALSLEERRLGRDGPALTTRLFYPPTSLWPSRAALKRADHIFCLNEEDRGYLLGRLGIHEDRITRIFPGADRLYSEAAEARDYGGAQRLLFAATWRKNKGIEDLVPAFGALHDQYPQLELIVLGAGVPPDRVRDAFPPLVRSAVSCLTTRNEAETARAFAAADIFVLPSLFEGTPLTLIEAMASGLPIVTTAVCGMRDVVEHGRNGLLVSIRSPEQIVRAIRHLIEDKDLRRRLGAAAKLDAQQRYTWELAADRVARAYERLLANRFPATAKAS